MILDIKCDEASMFMWRWVLSHALETGNLYRSDNEMSYIESTWTFLQDVRFRFIQELFKDFSRQQLKSKSFTRRYKPWYIYMNIFFSRMTLLFRRQCKLKQKHTLFWARIIMILRKIWMKSKNKSTECLEGKETFF